jgi:hypothetical protein
VVGGRYFSASERFEQVLVQGWQVIDLEKVAGAAIGSVKDWRPPPGGISAEARRNPARGLFRAPE